MNILQIDYLKTRRARVAITVHRAERIPRREVEPRPQTNLDGDEKAQSSHSPDVQQNSPESDTNPYVFLTCGATRHRTAACVKTSNPVWNENFVFEITDLGAYLLRR